MKKLLTLVLALAMTLSLAACGGGGEDTADEGSEGSTSGEPTKMTLIRGAAPTASPWRPAWPPLKRSTTWTSK